MKFIPLLTLSLLAIASCRNNEALTEKMATRGFLSSSFQTGKVNYFISVDPKSESVTGVVSNGTQEVISWESTNFTIIDVATSEEWKLEGKWGTIYIISKDRTIKEFKGAISYTKENLKFNDSLHPLIKKAHEKYESNQATKQ